MAGQRVNATYVDLVPDRTMTAQRTGPVEVRDSLDLDADGRFDLQINPIVTSVNFPSFSESRIMPLHNDVAIYSTSQGPVIIQFASNDTIQERMRQAYPQLPNVWSSRSTMYANIPPWLTRTGNNPAGIQNYGYWVGGQDGYVGVRLRSGTTGAWRYGWVRAQTIVNSTVSATIVVKDYALTNLALSQRSTLALGWQVSPVPTTAWISIKPPTPVSGQLTVVDAVGRVRLSAQFSPANAQFDLSGLPAGVYFMRLKTAREIFTQRIIKQ